MDLRMIILVIGLVIIGAIWFDGRRRHRQSTRIKDFDETCLEVSPKTSTFFSDTQHSSLDPLLMEEVETLDTPTATTSSPQATLDMILAFRLLPKGEGAAFSARQVLEALTRFGLTLDDKRQIYHAFSDQGATTVPAFSIANAFEPGTLPATPTEMQIHGLVFFTALGDQAQPSFTFERMLLTARRIADVLGGELYDSQHQRMTPQMVSYYRDQILGAGALTNDLRKTR